MSQRTVDIITMGCSKNLVDSEHLLRQFQEQGFKIYHNPETTHGDIAVVNTCGFIGDAKEESINMILSLCDLKENGDLKKSTSWAASPSVISLSWKRRFHK